MDQATLITVKKTDGTFERVLLSSVLGKHKVSAPISKPATPITTEPEPPKPLEPAKLAPVKKAEVKVPASQPKKTVEQKVPAKKLSILQPDRFGRAAEAEVFDEPKGTEDYLAPLDEPLEPQIFGATFSSSPRLDQVEAVLKQLNFTVPADLQSRLRTIIQLRLKDVRSEEQSKGSLVRAVLDGGVALSEQDANAVLSGIAFVQGQAPAAKTNLQIPNLRQLKKAPIVKIPEVYPQPGLPSTTTPNNAFVHGRLGSVGGSQTLSVATERAGRGLASVARVLPTVPSIAMEGRQMSPPTNATMPTLKLSSTPKPRPTMSDVLPSRRPAEMGPVDEIRYFTLTDFRRLAPTAEEAAARLKQKFINLREESIISFFDALDAWRQSPLYTDYVSLVGESASLGKTFSNLQMDKNRIQLSEIKSLTAMEQDLSL